MASQTPASNRSAAGTEPVSLVPGGEIGAEDQEFGFEGQASASLSSCRAIACSSSAISGAHSARRRNSFAASRKNRRVLSHCFIGCAADSIIERGSRPNGR